VGNVAYVEKMENEYRNVVGKPERKTRTLG
jgi:hypothetical protein